MAERAERFAVFGVKRHGADARSAVPHPPARFVRALAQNGSNPRRERFRAAPQRERVRFVFGKHSGKRRVRLYIIAVYGKDIIAGAECRLRVQGILSHRLHKFPKVRQQ